MAPLLIMSVPAAPAEKPMSSSAVFVQAEPAPSTVTAPLELADIAAVTGGAAASDN